MATATCQLSEDQFLCSICLDVFTDPVSTPCGHTFCKQCISRHWSDTTTYQCPYCKEVFKKRPELRVNIFISEMAAQFRQSQQVSDRSEPQVVNPEETPCDVCLDPKLKALKSCLVCLTSFCESHLQPHLSVPNLNRHELIEPTNDLDKRVCREHNKPLELFCKHDQVCVCMLCTYSQHNSHVVVPLKNVSEEKKEELMKSNAEIQKMIKTTEVKIQQLRSSVEVSDEAADRELTEGVKVLTALRELVDRALENLTQEISTIQKTRQQKCTHQIKDLEQEVSDLKERSSRIEQLLCSEDHLHILQHYSQLSSPPPVQHWTEDSVSTPQYRESVKRALSELKEEYNKMIETDLLKDKPVQEYKKMNETRLLKDEPVQEYKKMNETRLLRNKPVPRKGHPSPRSLQEYNSRQLYYYNGQYKPLRDLIFK